MPLFDFQPIRNNRNGFTIIEMLLVIAAVSLIIVLAVPVYHNYQEHHNVKQATRDISVINVSVIKYLLANNKLPVDLSAVGMSSMQDPWGNPYQYINHGASLPNQHRKDKSLLPINNDYDIYSLGKDSNTALTLTEKFARDDIVLANNGKWIGKVETY
jgi:general secretion pathway protein G